MADNSCVTQFYALLYFCGLAIDAKALDAMYTIEDWKEITQLVS